VQKRNHEGKCSNPACGQHIQFLMLGGISDRANPTCFCGGAMKRSYVKPHLTKYESILLDEPVAPPAPRVTVKLSVVARDAMTCLLPGSGG
jgi:hypothetical protein